MCKSQMVSGLKDFMENEKHHIDKEKVVISIRDLYKSFGDKKVLQGIDLDVYKGENVVVLGRSGTGKSVLIKIICGLLKPDSGIVNVLGQEVAKLNNRNLQQLRLKVGFSFQNSALYDSMTVRENLAFPLVRHSRNMTSQQVTEAIEAVLDDVGLSQTIDQMPAELSGGQRKRVGIARTLILNPEIMLYDEPTAGLDPITSIEINNLINLVQEKFNTTSIIITHDMACAKKTADRIVVMDDGKYIAEGSYAELENSTDEFINSFFKL